MCLICDGYDLSILEKLECCYCDNLIEIPNIPGLKILICNGCINLESIAVIEGLQEYKSGSIISHRIIYIQL